MAAGLARPGARPSRRLATGIELLPRGGSGLAALGGQKRNEPRGAAHGNSSGEELSGERFNGACQTALVTSGFVLMHDFFIGNAVDDAGRLLKHF